ncbi:MAG: hypothetical protein IH623_20760 [Verrucomicrobia bacterium]|nr:hypothetical protein [Verrucomicrobiota bacterium]
MELESFKTAFELGSKALTMIKQVKDLLPLSPQRDVAEKAIEDAENAFRIAEAKAAQEFGYNLCQCTWPPQIMLLAKNGNYRCPMCGNELDTTMCSSSQQ